MAVSLLLLVTVVMGVLLAGTGVAVARMRRGERYVPALRRSGGPSGRSGGASVGSAGVALGVAVLLVVAGASAAVGVGTLALLAGPALVVAYLSWGIYTLARSRGLPKAHSVGLSAWVIGVVLIGVVAVQLLLG